MCWVNTEPFFQAFFYTSARAANVWLLLKERDKFTGIPAEELDEFGEPRFAGMLPLRRREHYMGLEAEEAMEVLQKKGYFFRRF